MVPEDEDVQQLDADEEGSPSQSEEQQNLSRAPSAVQQFQDQSEEGVQPRQQFQIISKDKREEALEIREEVADPREEVVQK
jgi:hypothetical protein